jgi:hypothetical protein
LSASNADFVSHVINSTNWESQTRCTESNMKLALAVACIAFITPTLAAAYQSQENQTINHSGSKDNANNLMYQQGLNRGQADRTNNQPHQYRLQPNDSDDRRAYEAGYDQGYQANRDSSSYPAGEIGQYAPRSEPNGNMATQNGFQDGANDGLQDRQAGHSSRATKHHSYEHGNRGYEASFGSRINTRLRTVRPTFKDTTRAITAKAPITGNRIRVTRGCLLDEALPKRQARRVNEEPKRVSPTHSV